jgi:hypothetical protein
LQNYAAHKIIKPHEFVHDLTIHDHRLLVIAANTEDRNKMPVYSAAEIQFYLKSSLDEYLN